MKKNWIIVILVALSGNIYCWGENITTTDGRKFDGKIGIEDKYVIVKGKEETNRINIEEIRSIKFRDIIRTYTLIPEERQGISVVIRHGVPLEQSTNDAINGIKGIGIPLGKVEKIDVSWLSDAVSENYPADDNGGFAGEVVWDLGGNIGAEERELKEISVWIRSDDKEHCDYSGMFEISDGGKIFFPLEGSYTNVYFYELFGRGFSGTFNNVRYYFEPGAVSGFRYLKFKAFPSLRSHSESRFVELDVFVNRIKPSYPKVVQVQLIDKTTLVGVLKQFNSREIIVDVEKVELKVPLVKVGKVFFKNFFNDKNEDNSERIGVFLDTGDFIEGEVEEIDNDVVKLHSILLGVKKLSIRLNVTGIVFRKIKQADYGVKVCTKYGSDILCDSIRLEQDKIILKSRLLGEIEFTYDKIGEIQFGKPR
ncbi:MAG: hypothetical protein ACP5K7_06195 [Verrucomicrobiia bacterium]